MLGSRIAVAAVALPLLVAAVLLGGWVFVAVVTVALVIGAFEMMDARSDTEAFNCLCVVAATGAIPLAVWVDTTWADIVMFILFLSVPLTALLIGGAQDSVHNLIWDVITVAYLGILGSHFILIREIPSGVEWVALALATIILVDTGAYAFGKTIGRHQMAPKLSPGKTWEGTAGGFVTGFVTVLVANQITGLHITFGHQLLLGTLLPMAAILGDLLESKMKRILNVKDMGHILGGHGGIVDRIDSWLVTVPILYWYIQLFM